MTKFFLYLLMTGPLVFAQQGIITTYAGGYPSGIPGPAKDAALIFPNSVAEDAQGNYIVVGSTHIYKLTADGGLTTIAGTGFRGSSGDGGPATRARIGVGVYGGGLVVDPKGNVIFADNLNSRVRQISVSGIITTIAGSGVFGFAGDGGPAISARLSTPTGLALDSQGNLYIADTGNNRVRRLGTDGTISTVAGDGTPGYRGDGGPGIRAALNYPHGVALDLQGNLLIADVSNNVVRKLAADGTISTVASSLSPRNPANTIWGNPLVLAVDKAGNLYIGVDYRVLKMDSSGTISPYAGAGGFIDSDLPVPALQAQMGAPAGLLIDSKGNLILGLTTGSNRVGKVDPSGRFSYIAGVSPSAGASGPPAFARVYQPGPLAFDVEGNLNVDQGVLGVRKITAAGISRIVPYLGGSSVIAFDQTGNLYRTNTSAHIIQKIDAAGRATIVAGRSGTAGFNGDGGKATDAVLNFPYGVTIAPDGSLYFTDQGNNRVRKVTPDGIISTIAGGGAALGDNGPALAAQLNSPTGVALDSKGNVYVADTNNNRLRKISTDGTISTVAGNGVNSSTGDNGPAVQAALSLPRWITLDAADSIYVSENATRVRKVTAGGIITSVAGNGTLDYSGDGGPAVSAALNGVQGLAVDVNGNLYISDLANNRIRRISAATPFTVTPRLLLSSTLEGPAITQVLSLGTTDGSPRRFQVRTNVPWLTVPAATGLVSAFQPAQLEITANPAGRSKGSYSGVVTVVDPDSGTSSGIQVTLTVSGSSPQLRLSQVGLTFLAVQNGSAPDPQSFQILNIGTGSLGWSAAATTFSGAGWLAVSPASGTATANAASAVSVRVNPAGLAPGAYYGQINISAPGVDNSPQSAIVLLRVLPTDGVPGLQFDPYGLLFTSTTSNPASQNVTIVNPSTRTTSYTVALSLANGNGWLTIPPNGALTAGERKVIEIQPRIAGLAAGVYRATLAFDFVPESLTRKVEVALVVNPAGETGGRSAAASCIAKQLVAVLRRPGAGYQTAAGWPVPMEAAVVDDCGVPFTSGRVSASFSTNDPAIPMLHSGGGTWQATWASRSTQVANDLTIRLSAEDPDQGLAGTTQVAIRSNLSSDQPSITAGGVVNAASFRADSPVAVGGYVSIFGSRFATAFQQAQTLPLPNSLSDTALFLGGKAVPLHFASDGQVNAILPYGIADNTTQQLIVRRGNIPSLPESILVATSQPAVFSFDGSGTGQGHIYVVRADGTFLADSAHPVKPGDVILFYATGLGPVTPAVVEGQAAPSSPVALTVNPITVTIQGKTARVVFAGLAPGFAGVYQVNAVVPDDLNPDPSAQLVVSSADQPSPVASIAVTK